MAKKGAKLKPSKVDQKSKRQEKVARKLEDKKMKGRKARVS